MFLFEELKRRNVFRVGAAYVVVGWLIIQVVETIFPIYGISESWIRLVITVLAIGLIPVVIFAWAFELTPDGIMKESDVDRTQSITPNTGKKLDRTIMVVLALALVYFAVDKFVFDPQRDFAMEEQKVAEVEQARQEGRTEALVESYGEKSIAVLAFDDMSQDGDQEYLSDGIAEELLNLLAKIPELRVISRSSAFSFKGKDLPLTEIAEQLNVAHILEGSVRKAGNKVRITAQLIEARSDTHLWSETYDRELDDIFAIQDEISATVVEQLKITLMGQVPHIEEIDPEAYALYLQARHLNRLSTPESFQQSDALLEQALAIDPEYAAAWDGLATNYINMAAAGMLPVNDPYTKARDSIDKALVIDANYAPAHAGLSSIAMFYNKDLLQAARHMERALQLEPSNTDILRAAALLLQGLGRLDQSITISEFLQARDPVNPMIHYNLGVGYLDSGEWDKAIASFETILRLSPGFFGAHYWMGNALLFKGELEAALESYTREEDEEYRTKGQALALYALGRQEEHQAKLDELIEGWGEQWPSEVAHVYAFMSDADNAFEWLNHAIEQNEDGLNEQFLHDIFRPIHNDPRWQEFRERTGTSPEQLDAIEFEVKLPGQK